MTHIDSNIAVRKLDGIIAAGKDKAARGLTALAEEWGLRQDFLVKPGAVEIDVSSGDIRPRFERRTLDVTPHSRTQLLERSGIPLAFADRLIGLKQQDLLRHNMEWLLPKVSGDAMLMRVVKGTAKGVLSASYKRIDASPMFEGFVQTATRLGLVPYNGMVTDSRALLSFIQPEIREIAPGEFVVFGMELRTSDYGNGALQAALFILRLICSNGQTGMDLFRKVHLGRRFGSDDMGSGPVVELSSRTLALDAAAVRSALQDTVGHADKHFNALEEAIKPRVNAEVNLSTALATLGKKGLRKDVLEKVKTMYEAELPVEAVPAGNTAWRLSNVLSLIANSAKGDEATDLRDAAFTVLLPKAA